MPRKLNGIKIAKEIAKERNGECLLKLYKDSKTPIMWRCKVCNTKWGANLYNIRKKGTWCPKCGRNKLKHTIKMCQKIAKNRNGKCLEDKYIQSKIRMLWECNKGHKWRAQFCDIIRGSWCKRCAAAKNSLKHSIKDAINVAKLNGGKCISDIYIPPPNKMTWECSSGHIWKATFCSINKGSWCPKCKQKSQRLLFNIIKDIYPALNIEYNYKDFPWLKNKNKHGSQEIDIFVYNEDRTFTLAIEYDGMQHFKPVCFGGMSKERAADNLKYIKKLDKRKNQRIYRHKKDVKYFIRFSYKEKLSMGNIKNKLDKKKVPTENIFCKEGI